MIRTLRRRGTYKGLREWCRIQTDGRQVECVDINTLPTLCWSDAMAREAGDVGRRYFEQDLEGIVD